MLAQKAVAKPVYQKKTRLVKYKPAKGVSYKRVSGIFSHNGT